MAPEPREIMLTEHHDGTWTLRVVYLGEKYIDRRLAKIETSDDLVLLLQEISYWIDAEAREVARPAQMQRREMAADMMGRIEEIRRMLGDIAQAGGTVEVRIAWEILDAYDYQYRELEEFKTACVCLSDRDKRLGGRFYGPNAPHDKPRG